MKSSEFVVALPKYLKVKEKVWYPEEAPEIEFLRLTAQRITEHIKEIEIVLKKDNKII